MAKTARIVVADEYPMVRLGISTLLGRQSNLKIAGEAADGNALLKSVGALQPDVVIADVFLPESPGLDLIRAIRSQHAQARVLIHAGYDEILFAERAVRAGAAGYVMKGEPASTLLQAVRHILEGGIFVTPRATGRLLQQMAGHRSKGDALPRALSDRELEVLRRMGQGYTSREMAAALHVSIKTVEAHREHIKTKLGLGSSSELLRLGIEWLHSSRG